MVHRRTLADDARGVDEPLNETVGGITPYPDAIRIGKGITTIGTHRILIGKGPSGASLARSVMDGVFTEPSVFVSSASPDNVPSFKVASFSGLSETMPPNVILVTFKRMFDDIEPYFVVRLGHQYDTDEDEILSSDVQVNLASLFNGWQVESIQEMTLTANQEWSTFVNNQMKWGDQNLSVENVNADNSTITLTPMDIRTFKIIAKPKQ